jgi:hypothetical protein
MQQIIHETFKIPVINDIRTLFVSWYKNKLFDFTPTNKNDKSVLKKISKMLTYTKRFLPDGTNIPLPPNEDDVEAHRQYHHVSGNLGKNVQTEIMKFLKEYSNNNDLRISKSTFNKFEKIPMSTSFKKI